MKLRGIDHDAVYESATRLAIQRGYFRARWMRRSNLYLHAFCDWVVCVVCRSLVLARRAADTGEHA